MSRIVDKMNSDVLKPQRTRKEDSSKWKSILKSQAKGFCLSTSLHGYKYIVQSNRSKPEKVIWALIVVASLSCSIVCTKIAADYIMAYNSLIVIESKHNGIWNYPFPAVTICNNNRIFYSRARRFVYSLPNVDNAKRQFILEEMRLLIEMLDPGVFDSDIHRNLSRLQDIFDANNYTVSEVMKLVSQNCSSLLKSCKWNGDFMPCEELFEESYSRDGHCCSFNYIHPQSKLYSKAEPKRINSCGYQTGLHVLVDAEADDYFSSLYSFFGVKERDKLTCFARKYLCKRSEFDLKKMLKSSFSFFLIVNDCFEKINLCYKSPIPMYRNWRVRSKQVKVLIRKLEF